MRYKSDAHTLRSRWYHFIQVARCKWHIYACSLTWTSSSFVYCSNKSTRSNLTNEFFDLLRPILTFIYVIAPVVAILFICNTKWLLHISKHIHHGKVSSDASESCPSWDSDLNSSGLLWKSFIDDARQTERLRKLEQIKIRPSSNLNHLLRSISANSSHRV